MSDAPPDPATGPADRLEAAPTFPHKPFLRVGYDRAAVDEFVAKVALAVHNERQTSVSADDVARMRFPGRRLGRGYRMREVDDYLGAAEALLRARATSRGVGPEPDAHQDPHADPHHDPGHRHARTWWIYAIVLVLAVVIVVFPLAQT